MPEGMADRSDTTRYCDARECFRTRASLAAHRRNCL